MISISIGTFDHLSNKDYIELVSKINIDTLACSCGKTHTLLRHGSYKRYIKYIEERICLVVSRVKCKSCKRTHALMPSSIVPYSQIIVRTQANVIIDSEAQNEAYKTLLSNPDINEFDRRNIIKKYLSYWQKKIISRSIPLSPLPKLISECFRLEHMQFMQLRSIPNILYLNST